MAQQRCIKLLKPRCIPDRIECYAANGGKLATGDYWTLRTIELGVTAQQSLHRGWLIRSCKQRPCFCNERRRDRIYRPAETGIDAKRHRERGSATERANAVPDRKVRCARNISIYRNCDAIRCTGDDAGISCSPILELTPFDGHQPTLRS